MPFSTLPRLATLPVKGKDIVAVRLSDCFIVACASIATGMSFHRDLDRKYRRGYRRTPFAINALRRPLLRSVQAVPTVDFFKVNLPEFQNLLLQRFSSVATFA